MTPLLHSCNIAHYNGLDQAQRLVAIPEVAALYVWVFDFESLLGRSEASVKAALGRFFGLSGRRITATGKDPFVDAEWRAVRMPLPDDRLTAITHGIVTALPTAAQVAHFATIGQRPLYVGVTGNLSKRVEQHLAGDSALAGSGPVLLTDCAVQWTALPGVAPSLDEDENGELLDDLAPSVTMYESLLIRSMSPLLNVRIDS